MTEDPLVREIKEAVAKSNGDLEIVLDEAQAAMLVRALDALPVLEAFRVLVRHRMKNPEDPEPEPGD